MSPSPGLEAPASNLEPKEKYGGGPSTSRRKNLNLTEAEFQQHKAQGLHFSCEEKFTPGHRCKKELHLVLVHDPTQNSISDAEAQNMSEDDGEQTIDEEGVFNENLGDEREHSGSRGDGAH